MKIGLEGDDLSPAIMEAKKSRGHTGLRKYERNSSSHE